MGNCVTDLLTHFHGRQSHRDRLESRFTFKNQHFWSKNQLLHSLGARSSRFGFGQSEHVWWPHHDHSVRKRRENVAFTQLGRGGDVVDVGRGCGGLQPNILVRMKVFSLYFH